MSLATDRFTATGDEAGSAPGDRPFRPDVQGLRAVAILLVVLFHAGIPGISGGYVGVDVFFVISGFVITGVLLREREATGTTSLRSFYGRRARRIIPAATLVIIVTVVAAYHYLGPLVGHDTAVDGKWAALFLANFHFAAAQTNYLASQQPPSALQNYWSLAVEEQFYIVYPTIFLILARFVRWRTLRVRLTIALCVVVVASYAFSIAYTSANAPSAFFSPLTRAWELALGALIAVASQNLRHLPKPLAALLSWLGLAAIVVACTSLDSATVYPGALVALPVLGAGLIIAGGASQPTWGVETLLRQRPFQWLGLISFSLYLWHWPVLVIATQHRGSSSLPVWDNVLLLLVATGLAIITFRILENPVRHSRFLRGRRWASLVMGLCLVAGTLVVTTYEQHRPSVNLGTLETVTSGSHCPLQPQSLVSQLRSTYTSGLHPRAHEPGQLQSVVVIGDSTSCTLLPGLDAVGPSFGMKFENGAVIGCGVVSGLIAPNYIFGNVNVSDYTKRCQGEANLAETQAVDTYHPSLIVWGSTEEHNSVVADTPSGSKVLGAGSPEWKSVMLRRMNDRVDQFLAAGAKVILVLEPPEVNKSGGKGPIDATDIDYEHMNALLTEVAAQHPGRVGLVDLEARVCPTGPPCQFVVDGIGATVATEKQAIRPDLLHYLPVGSLWVARWLVPQIAQAEKKLS